MVQPNFRDVDPSSTIATWPPDIVAAVGAGQLVVGMTKQQALTARAYPPFHRTDNLESDEWVYYENGDVVEMLSFTNDRISAITTGPPPDRRYTNLLSLEPFSFVSLVADPAGVANTPESPKRQSGGSPSTQASDDAAARLRELQDMYERGVISTDEYRRARTRIIGQL